MIMLNVCAVICSTGIYYWLSLRQRHSAGQRERYFTGPFLSLAEARLSAAGQPVTQQGGDPKLFRMNAEEVGLDFVLQRSLRG
eukprot:6041120-Amphidinium_carterae.1